MHRNLYLRRLRFIATPIDDDQPGGGTAPAGDDSTPPEPAAPGTPADDDEDEIEDPPGSDQLRDEGKQALDRMKEKVRAANRARRDAEHRLQQIEDEKAKAEGDAEQVEAVRAAEREALAKANKRIVHAEVRAAAKGVLEDPADAFRYLAEELGEIDVSDDGEVDTEEIKALVADLVTKKPYLAAQRRLGEGEFDSGRRKDIPKSQLPKSALKNMSPEEINKARREGRFDHALGRSRP